MPPTPPSGGDPELEMLRRCANVRTCIAMYNWAREDGRDELAHYYKARALLQRADLAERVPEVEA